MRTICIHFLLLFVLCPVSILYAEESLERLVVITEELNCVTGHRVMSEDLTWGEVCYTPATYRKIERFDAVTDALDAMETERDLTYREGEPTRAPFREREGRVLQPKKTEPQASWQWWKKGKEESDEVSEEPIEYKPDVRPVYEDRPSQERLIEFEMGTETFYHKYKEPGIIEQDGFLYGINAAYTHRLSFNEDKKTLMDHYNPDEVLNMFRIEGMAAIGSVDFEGGELGNYDGRQNWMYDIRGLAGYDFPIFENTRVTPFTGIAFRYFNDRTPGRTLPFSSFSGPFAFTRESKHLYMPFGVMYFTKNKKGWDLTFNFEYDLLLYGLQTNHYEDGGLKVIEAVTLNVFSLDSLTYQQKGGWGVRTSVRLAKEWENVNFFVEPFFRFWRLSDSEREGFTSNSGSVYWFGDTSDPSTQRIGIQNKNFTQEAGIKVGFHF